MRDSIEMFNNIGLTCLLIAIILGILGRVLKLRRFSYIGYGSAFKYLLFSFAIGLALYIPTMMWLGDTWPYPRRDPTYMFPAGIVTSIVMLLDGVSKPFMLVAFKKCNKNSILSILGAALYTFTLFLLVAFVGSFLICMYNGFKVVQLFIQDFRARKVAYVQTVDTVLKKDDENP